LKIYENLSCRFASVVAVAVFGARDRPAVKWVDKKRKTQYGDTPPAGVKRRR